MASKTKADYERDYTEPALREKLKEEILKSEKGGRSGQWSARKSQLLTQQYEKQGGGYKNEKPSESQKSLKKWTQEEWQTSSGAARARHGKTTERYLPKAAWEKLSAEEKRAANTTKREGSAKGKQFVENPAAARKAGRAARKQGKATGRRK